MWNKSWCTDEFGNVFPSIVGNKVRDSLAEFYVGSISRSGLNWWLHMDPSKPYTILDQDNPMKVCVEGGHYSVLAIACRKVV